MSSHIVNQFLEHVRLRPEATAIEFENLEISYLELNHYSNRIAKKLLENGVLPNSAIAVSGIKSIEMIAAIIAVLKLKCCYVPVDINLPKRQIAHMFKSAKIKTLITIGINEKINNFPKVRHINLSQCSSFKQELHHQNLDGANEANIDACDIDISDLSASELHANDPAYIMFTSGSTGTPKGAILPHKAVLRLVVQSNYIEITPKDSVLFHSNTSFDAAIFEIWAALLNGAKISISTCAIGDLLAIFDHCERKKITILLLTTSLFHIFSELSLDKLIHLKYLVVGGEVMYKTQAERAIQKSKNFKIINGYGPAENGVFTTCHVITNLSDIHNPISIGKPISNTKVYVLDKERKPVPNGEIGELYTTGDGVALGYINNPKLTKEKFVALEHLPNKEIAYRTGDLVKKLPSGDYEFIGRTDHQVKIKGFRVELREIEHVLINLKFVEDACVFVQNEKLIAFVKIKKNDINFAPSNKSLIYTYLKNKLPEYCIPAHIEFREIFPLTTNGKIDRKSLATQLNLKFKECV